jgi:L-aspartate oxidase
MAPSASIRHRLHVLIIGAGLAGTTAALTLADAGHEVALITDGEADGGNSSLAQGGIIHRPDRSDIPALEKDILTAGHNHNSRRAVSFLARRGPDIVRRVLMEQAPVPFDRDSDGSLNFTREGGHSAARIIHCADHTGRSIMQSMLAAARGLSNIRLLTGHTAVDLITSHHHTREQTYRYQLSNQCLGAYVFNESSRQVETMLADWTILATGGVGRVFLHSTNGPSAIGSGIAMAHRAGVRLDNLEYMQFHPTSLFHRGNQRFLITEALRGEGARLINSQGEAFVAGYDPRGDLAPRDIVSRAIADELLRLGDDCVYLDLSGVKQDIPERFPTIYRHCLDIGLDITRSPIPVVPAAHYFCGGILTDLQGRSTLERLYSVGECSCTGLHGANRLASTSLLEALLWGNSAGRHIIRQGRGARPLSARLLDSIPDWESPGCEQNDDPALLAQDWSAIRHTMWNYVGITRTAGRLRRAFADLRDQSSHLHDFYKRTPLSKPLINLFHGSHTAYIITQAALRNPVALGCHYRTD